MASPPGIHVTSIPSPFLLTASVLGGAFFLLSIQNGFSSDNVSVSGAEADLVPFGVSGDNQTTESLYTWGGPMAAAGIRWMRGIDTFGNIESKEGTWNWKNVDAEMAAAADNHLQVSGLFFYSAPWIAANQGLPTANLPAWKTYVSTLVKHVAGKIKYWEVWNEPPNFTDQAPPADYAKTVIAAYDAAKAADPGCRVGLAAQSVNLNWLDQTLQAGATGHFDYITLHPYETLDAVDDGWEPEFMAIVPTLRKVLAARDPAHVGVPVWFTEIGMAISDQASAQRQAQNLVKAYAMGLAQGVARICWFEGKDGDSGPEGLLEADGKPRPAYTALTQVIKYLGEKPHYVGWFLLKNRDHGFVFQGPGGPVLVAWAPLKRNDRIDLGKTAQIVDPLTGSTSNVKTVSLTNAPVLILRVPAAWATVARANSGHPYPWDGDYTEAKSVAVTLNASKQETGLHVFKTDLSSATVMIPYGPALDCGKTGQGPSFTVDPNFLSYTSRPISITAVVRRDAASENAGFNLKYESTSGFKSTGSWYTVPDKKGWSTQTWTITDPQFVGKWGFNFTFDSDGPAFSKYYLQSVTVTKR